MPMRLSGLVSGMDTEAMVAELMKAQRQKTTKLQNKITTLDWKQEKWKALNTKIYSFYTGILSKMRFPSNYNTKKVTTTADNLVTVTGNSDAVDGTHTLKIKQLASSQYFTGDTVGTVNNEQITKDTLLSDLGFTSSDTITVTTSKSDAPIEIAVGAYKTVGDLLNQFKKVGINASFDSNQKRIFLSSQSSGETQGAFTLTTSNAGALSKLGLCEITQDILKGSDNVAAGCTLVKATDAIVYYNDVELKSATNNISVNGLTMELKGVTTGDQKINLNVTNDTQAAYDMIKSFIKGYNEILKEMNEAYNADSARGYDPLTDEQKEAMTDSQIEKWEDKIKSALLRRDTTLQTLISTFRSTMSSYVEYNGKNYSLSKFGIGTSSDYSERGLLHIDGNPEDEKTMAFEDKLMKALTENPTEVANVLSAFAKNLYTSLTDKMSSTSLRSAYKVYNDKEMADVQKKQKSKLSQLEKKLAEMENKYYKQFSKMESAMAKLNSESSSLTSMLGLN